MRVTFKTLLAIIVLGVFSIQGAHALSLKLKKQQAATQKKIDGQIEDITKKCGCTPTVEIDWESFTTKDEFRIASANMGYVRDGMVLVCKEFKKEVCDGVKTVKIKKDAKMNKSLMDGVLDLSIDDPSHVYTGSTIQKLIEEKL